MYRILAPLSRILVSVQMEDCNVFRDVGGGGRQSQWT